MNTNFSNRISNGFRPASRRFFRSAPLSALLPVLFLFGTAFVSPAEEFAPLFPFVVSYEIPEGGVDMSGLLDAPAGKHGFVRVQGDRFVTDAGEIRFWATNLSGRANFPDKSYADKLADRLARLGINCVRLHHMDSWAIWGKNPKSLRKIDPEMLDRLDYLIAALKKRGIYTNINLHVGRWMDDRDGFPHKDKRPNYDKGLDNFYPPLIELQKEFARDLLTHVNPYTKLAYVDEPAVAMIEINNENSVVMQWVGWSGKNMDDLPDPYGAFFRKRWNDFLLKKYGSTEKTAQAWNRVDIPFGDEMVDGNMSLWYLQTKAGDKGQAELAIEPDPADSVKKILRLTVRREGDVEWVPQLLRSRLDFKKGEPHTFSLRIRSKEPGSVSLLAETGGAPWKRLGLTETIETTPEWKTHVYCFQPLEDAENARIGFRKLKTGEYEIADVSFRRGGDLRLDAAARIEEGTLPILKRSDTIFTEPQRRDFWEFLIDVEWKYWPDLYRYVKNDLKARQPISGTQLYYGSKHVQAELDYCDDHAYWNHPSWPSKRWDQEDWFIRNRALVNWAEQAIFTSLGNRRIEGKPHTVSEYNHPFPNQFAAEGMPMICAFSQFQGWNGIFQYTYAHEANIEPEKITGFFDMIAQAGQLVHAPACAAMILRGDVAPAKRTILAPYDRPTELDTLVAADNPGTNAFYRVGFDARLSLLHRTALDLSARKGTDPGSVPTIPKDQKVFVGDTGELTWNLEQKDAGYFILNTEKTKVFSGFVRGRTFKIGDVELSFGKTRLDWATVSLTELAPGRLLLAATGLMENSGMKFEKYADDDTDRVTLHRNWGDAPLLCEGVPFELSCPNRGKSVKCFALNPDGTRKESVPVTTTPSRVSVAPGPGFKTLWYEIVFDGK